MCWVLPPACVLAMSLSVAVGSIGGVDELGICMHVEERSVEAIYLYTCPLRQPVAALHQPPCACTNATTPTALCCQPRVALRALLARRAYV